MKLYIASCETSEKKGGIYIYDTGKDGELKEDKYFPCDRPMYFAFSGENIDVLLRAPFKGSENSGYFRSDDRFTRVGGVKDALGKCACFNTVSGDNAYLVNYLSGNVVKNCENAVAHSGKGVHPTRQEAPHTHCVYALSDGNLAVCDLGLDTLFIYDKDLNEITKAKVPEGYGIRHIVQTKSGDTIYAVNELNPSISRFSYINGELRLAETVDMPCKDPTSTAAAIRLSDDEKFLYASVRYEDILCVFSLDNKKPVEVQRISSGGKSPRDFIVNKDYLVVTNENSDNVVVYRLIEGLIDEKVCEINLPHPLCAAFR